MRKPNFKSICCGAVATFLAATSLLITPAVNAGSLDNGNPEERLAKRESPAGLSPSGATKPLLAIPARFGACAIYDPVGERMIVFGGRNNALLFDTWTLSLGAGTPTWSQLSTQGAPPIDPIHCAAVYDPVRDRMLVFTGWDAQNTPTTEVYELWLSRTPGVPSTWGQSVRYGPIPPARFDQTAIYDPVGDRVIIFGGRRETVQGTILLGDTWELKLSGLPQVPFWQEITSPGAPPARYGHSAVYDPIGQRMFVLGGTPGGTPYFMTFWTLSLVPEETPVWSNPTANNAPTNRRDQTAIFDPTEDRIVVFGGRVDYPYVPCDDRRTSCLWIVRDVPPSSAEFGWGQYVPFGAAPLATYGHVAVFDPEPPNNRMIVFGGYRSTNGECVGNYTNETWSQSLIRNLPAVPWTQLSSTAGMTTLALEEATAPSTSFSVWPNPLHDRAQFSIAVPSAQRVSIVVFDIAGRHVATVTDDRLEPGVHSFEWSGRDANGQRMRHGVYRCRVRGETFGSTQTLVIMPSR